MIKPKNFIKFIVPYTIESITYFLFEKRPIKDEDKEYYYTSYNQKIRKDLNTIVYTIHPIINYT